MARLGRSRRFKPLVRVLRIVEPNLYPAAIDTAETWGVSSFNPDVAPTSIFPDEAFGIAFVGDSSVLQATAIVSGEAFGAVQFDADFTVIGIASAGAVGFPFIGGDIFPSGIGSAEAFGSPVTVIDIIPVGIVSAGAFGSQFVTPYQIIAPTGIPLPADTFPVSLPLELGGLERPLFGEPDVFDFGVKAPLQTVLPAVLPTPTVFEDQLHQQARTAMTAAQNAANISAAAPTQILVTFYDKIYRKRGECNDYLSVQCAFPRHLVETGSIVIKGDDPLAEAALICHEEVVPVTIEIGHLLWSGRIKIAKDRFGWSGEADTVVCELEGDRAWLMKIMAWPNFLLPLQTQFPPRGVAIGPAITVIRWLIATQAFRLQSGLWDLINNLGSLNLDWRSWFGTFLMADILGPDGQFDFSDIMRMLRTPIYVCQVNLANAFTGVLFDTSPFISVNWRMDKMYDLIDQIVKDNGLVVEVNLWRPGDPQPDSRMDFPLTTPTIVVDVKDRMGIVGPFGTFLDGILRTVIDLQDSIFGEITRPFLNPGNEVVPEGFNIAPVLGLHFVPPWVIFMADHPLSGCWGELAHHHPLAWRTIVGGKSPKWLNDLMNAFFSWILDSLMIIIGLTGLPSNLLDGLFNDVLLAFQLADNMTRRIKLGPYGYPEWFAPTGQAPYNIDALFALKREQWNTRGYVSGIMHFENGYPYDLGRDLFVGGLATIVKRNKAYTDFVENIVVTDTRDKLSVEVQIGDGKAEEDPSVKAYRNIVKIMEAINILTMSTQ